MKIRFFFALLSISLSLSISANVHTQGLKSLDPYIDIFETNDIFVTTPGVNTKDIENFLVEFKKFPSMLHLELVKSGGKIHLIHGEGVTDDPDWQKEHSSTFDGRAWSRVPGSGGYPTYGVLLELL